MKPRRRAAALAGAALILVASTATGWADTEDPPRMVVVLDSSGSMGEPHSSGATRMEMAKQALREFVPTIPPDAEVGLRLLGSRVDGDPMPAEACQDTELLVAPSADNRAELLTSVAGLEPVGWTPIPEALRQAAADVSGSGQRSILLVSDGESTCQPDPCEVAAELVATDTELVINVIGFDVDDSTRSQLQCIAANGNGTYTDVASVSELRLAIEETASRALRPFEYAGQPVTGGREASAAVALTAGYWLDEFPAANTQKQELWYKISRTQAQSVLTASLLTFPENKGSDGVEMQLQTLDGQRCFADNEIKPGGQLPLIMGTSTRATTSVTACQNASSYLLRLSRQKGTDATSPLPFQLRIQELPGWVEPTGSAPVVEFDGSAVPASTAQQIAPGTSLTNAPLMSPGSYVADLVPGEVQAFRLPVAFGQASRATVRVTAEDLARIHSYAGSLNLWAILPSGDQVDGAYAYQLLGDRAIEMSTETPPLWAGDRERLYQSGDVTYVLVWNPAEGAPEDLLLSFELSVEVAGTALETPAPLVAPTPSASPQPGTSSPTPVAVNTDTSPSSAATSPAPSTTGSGYAWLPWVIGISGVAVVGGGTALLVRRR